MFFFHSFPALDNGLHSAESSPAQAVRSPSPEPSLRQMFLPTLQKATPPNNGACFKSPSPRPVQKPTPMLTPAQTLAMTLIIKIRRLSKEELTPIAGSPETPMSRVLAADELHFKRQSNTYSSTIASLVFNLYLNLISNVFSRTRTVCPPTSDGHNS
jgi:hypothetical protein